MPDVDPLIQYGPAAEIDTILVDEPALLVQNITFTPIREKKSWKGPQQVTKLLRYTDPQLTIEFDAVVSDFTGLADQHPGTLVTELANYAGPVHGFDPGQGIIVYEDPVRSFTDDDPAKLKFKAHHYPFVDAA